MGSFTLDTDPCSKKEGFLDAGEFINGAPIRVPVAIARGTQDEPKLLLTGGVHGEEIGGIEAVGRVYRGVDASELKGTLIIVPIINVPAFTFRSRFYPFEWTQGAVTRLESPETSLCGRIGHTLAEKVIGEAGYAMDIHTARPGAMNYPWTAVQGGEPDDRYMDLALSTGTALLEIKKGKSPWSEMLSSKGIININVATGQGRRIDYPHPEILVRSIHNVMKKLGMIEGTPILPEKRVSITKRHEVWSTTSGLLHMKVEPGDYVFEGDPVAEITDFFNAVKERYTAPVSGIVGRVTLFAAIGIGDRICKIYETDRTDWKSRKIPELEKHI